MDGIMSYQPLLAIVSHTVFIAVAFFALQAIMPEKIIKKNRVFQAQLLYILLSIAIGSTVSNFFLELSYWSGRLPFMFG
ncbi:putative integral membrane protein (TIGR02327 family) [Sporosarcina sp. JAI121]|nr:putative integral membrane protein (TIGR02327 family) [Sporosarcina sp. JAI121]